MKRIIFLLTAILTCSISRAETFNQYWYVENNAPIQTTCETGGDITLPTAPTKYGYDFIGWEKLPYIPIEYLESTGEQYIDTGFKPNQDTGLEIKFMYPETYSKNRDSWIIASSNGGDTNSFGLTAWERFAIQYNGYSFISQSCVPGIDFIYIQNKNVSYLNNIKTSRNYTVFSSKRSLTIFAFNRDDASLKPPYLTIMRLYYTKLYDNDVLVRDFIPVLDKDGTPCMYDKVEGKFYYNAGTGDFIAGPVITE